MENEAAREAWAALEAQNPQPGSILHYHMAAAKASLEAQYENASSRADYHALLMEELDEYEGERAEHGNDDTYLAWCEQTYGPVTPPYERVTEVQLARVLELIAERSVFHYAGFEFDPDKVRAGADREEYACSRPAFEDIIQSLERIPADVVRSETQRKAAHTRLLLAAIQDHALANYDNGWDIVVEAMEDYELIELMAGDDPDSLPTMTPEQAIERVARMVEVHRDVRMGHDAEAAAAVGPEPRTNWNYRLVGKDEMPFGGYPEYPVGPGMVAATEWTFSYTTGAHIQGAILNSSRTLPDGTREQHPLNGKQYGTRWFAERAAYEAGLTAYMVYETSQWWDVPTPVLTEEDAKRRWDAWQPEKDTYGWYAKWFSENVSDLSGWHTHYVALWNDLHGWELEHMQFNGTAEEILINLRDEYQQINQDWADDEAERNG